MAELSDEAERERVNVLVKEGGFDNHPEEVARYLYLYKVRQYTDESIGAIITSHLPLHITVLTQLCSAFKFRSQFPYLGESGRLATPGLVYALRSALDGYGLSYPHIDLDEIRNPQPLDDFREKMETARRELHKSLNNYGVFSTTLRRFGIYEDESLQERLMHHLLGAIYRYCALSSVVVADPYP